MSSLLGLELATPRRPAKMIGQPETPIEAACPSGNWRPAIRPSSRKAGGIIRDRHERRRLPAIPMGGSAPFRDDRREGTQPVLGDRGQGRLRRPYLRTVRAVFPAHEGGPQASRYCQLFSTRRTVAASAGCASLSGGSASYSSQPPPSAL